MRFLFLAEDPRDRHLLEEALINEGLAGQIAHASSLKEFQAALEQTQFDLIISDFALPAYSGIAALTASKKLQPDITPVREHNGEISHFIAVKQDITKRKQLEEQVHFLTKTKRLEGQLHQAQTMEVMSQFAGSIAQDFNNFLNVIHDHTKTMLTDESKPGKQNRQQLKPVIAAAEKATHLTRQLLAFGRKQAIQFQPSDLNRVISSFAPKLDRLISAHIVLQYHYAGDLPPVNVDIGMIEQVLVNLIANARDALPQGGQIFISTEAISLDATYVEANFEARPGEFVCVTVRDTGTGIYPEYLPRIFEPFFTTQKAGKGAGLGLAIVHGIVKQHHGWVAISSQLGKGTTLKIFLPANASAGAKILIP